MAFLKSFQKSEDAYVTAAFLESEGISTTVFDDSSYGGNLMGTLDPDSIYIDVAEGDLERARELLEEQSTGDETSPAESTVLFPDAPKQDRTSLTLFRGLILLEVALIWLTAMFPGIYGPEPPENIQNYLNSLSISEQGWDFAYFMWPARITLDLISSLLMLMLLKMGRLLYLFSIVFGLIMFWGPPPVLQTSLGNTIGSIQWALPAVIATMSFLPPVSLYFRKRFTETR